MCSPSPLKLFIGTAVGSALPVLLYLLSLQLAEVNQEVQLQPRLKDEFEASFHFTASKPEDDIGKRFVARSQRVKQFCNERRAKNANSTLDHNIVQYSAKHQLLTCLVPKTGSTTMRRTMLRLVGVQTNVESKKKSLKKHLIPYYRYGKAFYQDLLFNPTVTRVTTARHPLNRLVSLYLDRWRGRSLAPIWKKMRQAYRQHIGVKAKHRYVPFKEYLEIIVFLKETRDVNHLNKHFRPSTVICDPCSINYDYIIHTETLSEDLGYLSRILSLPEINPNLHLNSHKKGADYFDYFEDLPLSLLKKVYAMYEDDFLFHGYVLPDFYKKIIEDDDALN